MVIHHKRYSTDFTQKINDAIKEGWQPYGSIGIEPETADSYATFYQPMVKYV